MKFLTLLLLVAACALSQSFAPPRVPASSATVVGRRQPTKIHINIGEPERDQLTRDTEPEDFFAT